MQNIIICSDVQMLDLASVVSFAKNYNSGVESAIKIQEHEQL